MRIEELPYVSVIFKKKLQNLNTIEHYLQYDTLNFFRRGRSKLVSLFKGIGSYNFPKFYTMITMHITFLHCMITIHIQIRNYLYVRNRK